MPLFKSDREKRNVRRGMDNPEERAEFYPTPRLNNMDTQQLQTKKPHRWRKRLLILSLILLLVVAVIAGLAYLFVTKTPLRGESSGRINILVMGVDDRANLSDTLMIVSINTKDKKHPKAAMISIPRDLYVDIPGYDSEKINAAYPFGENNDEPGGGVGLTKKTVEDNFDIPIHYHAALDFTGFEKIIDTIGGIDLNIPNDLEDPEYPDREQVGYESFALPAGQHHLDGATALKVARCRKGTCGNDYGRADRQQQIMVAAKNKIASTNVLLSTAKINALKDIAEEHLDTDISTREGLKLGNIWRKIPDSSITRHVLDTSNLLSSSQRYGYALIPNAGVGDFSEIIDFIKNIFDQTGNNLPEN